MDEHKLLRLTSRVSHIVEVWIFCKLYPKSPTKFCSNQTKMTFIKLDKNAKPLLMSSLRIRITNNWEHASLECL